MSCPAILSCLTWIKVSFACNEKLCFWDLFYYLIFVGLESEGELTYLPPRSSYVQQSFHKLDWRSLSAASCMWQLTYAADLGPKAGCYWASNDVSIPKQWFEMNSSYATVFARTFNILAGQRSFFFEFTITCPVSFVLASLLISPALT